MAKKARSVLDALRDANPRAPEDALRAYASALRDYVAAERNVAEHGAIVFHPRTGAPVENPFLTVRERCAATMSRCKLRETREAWELAASPDST
jgi:phage terminase small subunit